MFCYVLFTFATLFVLLQIVDLALLVKQDQRASQSDPLTRTMPHVVHNYHDLHSGAVYTCQAKVGVPPSPARVSLHHFK
jgi:hypothetical protein